MKKIKRALISVSDKKNLKPLLNVLKKNKVDAENNGSRKAFSTGSPSRQG